jgi:hypothetical protein
LIRKLWEVAWNQWEHRNRILHDAEDSLLRRQQLGEVQEQFALGMDTVTDDAKLLFQPGLDIILSYQREALEAWLHRVTMARERFERRRVDRRRGTYWQERTALASWLRSNSNPNREGGMEDA